MTHNKLKEWRAVVEKRLSALENLFGKRTNTPQDIEQQSHSGTPDQTAQSETKSVPKGRYISALKWPLRIGRWTAIVVTYLAATLGVVTGYLALVPKVTVTETEPLNPADVFTSQFIISNEGPLEINSVDAKCLITDVEFERDIHVRTSTMVTNGIKSRMGVGERGTISCPMTQIYVHTDAPVRSADIEILVSFRPDFGWWRPNRAFRFVTLADSKGDFHWFPEPIPSK